MTTEQLSQWRTNHPQYFSRFLEDLVAQIRLQRATPALTVGEMQAYVSDMHALQLLQPQAKALLAEAVKLSLEEVSTPAIATGITNAAKLLHLYGEVWPS